MLGIAVGGPGAAGSRPRGLSAARRCLVTRIVTARNLRGTAGTGAHRPWARSVRKSAARRWAILAFVAAREAAWRRDARCTSCPLVSACAAGCTAVHDSDLRTTSRAMALTAPAQSPRPARPCRSSVSRSSSGRRCSRFRSTSSTRWACRSPTSTATSATASPTRRSSTGSASGPTRCSAARSSRSSAATSTSSTTPTSTPRCPASAPATSGSWSRRAGRRSGSASTTTPTATAQGHVRGFLVTYSDVDHLKRLELEAGQREHRLRLVTDSVGLPILYFDRQLKLRFANKPFGRLDRRAGRRRARPRAEGRAAGRRAGGNAGLHRARVRRRHGVVRAARAPARRANRAGCASRCSPTARWAAASAARSR